jgi:SAM-dependent methyltransferase
MSLTAHEGCPVCQAPSPPLAFVKNGYPMHRCETCELVFSARPPRGDELESLYSADYFTQGGAGYPDYIADERTHRRQARTYLRKIEKLGVARGAVLDVGCAAGFFLDEARKRGWAARGCELSEYAHAHASERLGLEVERSGFLDPRFAPMPQSFDVITVFNVLEHIPNPKHVADKLFDLLKPGGYLVVETWDPRSWLARLLGSRWPTYAPPTVLYCFTRQTLAHLFDSERWTPVSYRPSMKWISLDHGLSLLEYEAVHTPLARAFAPVFGAVRRSFLGKLDVPYCLGDLAVAVYRRASPNAFRLRWNGAARTKPDGASPMSPGVPV